MLIASVHTVLQIPPAKRIDNNLHRGVPNAAKNLILVLLSQYGASTTDPLLCEKKNNILTIRNLKNPRKKIPKYF